MPVIDILNSSNIKYDNAGSGLQSRYVKDAIDEVAQLAGSLGFNLQDDEVINIGTGNDLKLYHNGVSSYITNSTGDLVLRGTNASSRISLETNNTSRLLLDANNYNVTFQGDFSSALYKRGNDSFTLTEYMLGAGPFTNMWHDLLAFNKAYTTVFETFNGTWNTGTANLELFAQKKDINLQIIDGVTDTAFRFTWNNVAWGFASYFAIGHTYNAIGPVINVVVESSATGAFAGEEVVRHTSTSISPNAVNHAYPLQSYGGDTHLRITVTSTNSQPVKLSYISLLTERPGDQGNGPEYQYPYTWDGNQNVNIGGNLRVYDNKVLKLGNDTDFQLYHSGTNSYIQNYTGNLSILSNALKLGNANGSKSYFYGVDAGSSYIYFNGAERLRTTNDGVTVTGDLTITGTTTTVNTANLSITDNLIYLNGDIKIDVASITGNGTTITINTATAHNLTQVGYTFKLDGFTPASYNGTYTVASIVDTDTITALSSNVDAITVYGELEYHSQANPDLGWVGSYNDGTYLHAGLFRDATDGVFKIFDSYVPEPTTDIDTGDVSFTLADLATGSLSVSSDFTITPASTASSGTNEIVNTSGTWMSIQGARINLLSEDGSRELAKFIDTDGVALLFNNATKLVTSSTGVDVTGDVNINGTPAATIDDATALAIALG